MKCDFIVGDKVVCVDDSDFWNIDDLYEPIKANTVYTIEKIGIPKNQWISYNRSEICIWVNEAKRPFNLGSSITRFRKVQKHKTDISIFKSMLNKSPEENNKELVESQVKDMIDV